MACDSLLRTSLILTEIDKHGSHAKLIPRVQTIICRIADWLNAESVANTMSEIKQNPHI